MTTIAAGLSAILVLALMARELTWRVRALTLVVLVAMIVALAR